MKPELVGTNSDEGGCSHDDDDVCCVIENELELELRERVAKKKQKERRKGNIIVVM
jgi:hypothetical protein